MRGAPPRRWRSKNSSIRRQASAAARLRPHPGQPQQRSGQPRPVLLVVEEAVARIGVDLEVVRHAEPGQGRLQPRHLPDEGLVPTAVAANHRAAAPQHLVDVLGDHAVVDRAGVEAVGRDQQREATAHAEPDHPDVAVDLGVGAQLLAAAGDQVERQSGPRPHRPEGRDHAPQLRALAEQVRRHHHIARGGEPVGLAAQHVVQSPRLVHHHHARPGPRTGGADDDGEVVGDPGVAGYGVHPRTLGRRGRLPAGPGPERGGGREGSGRDGRGGEGSGRRAAGAGSRAGLRSGRLLAASVSSAPSHRRAALIH